MHLAIYRNQNPPTDSAEEPKIEKTKKYRLPKTDEWEDACNGGIDIDVKDNNLSDYAWYKNNSQNRTHPVMNKKANQLGLFDMKGSVWEWCQDWYSKAEKQRNVRGGSWYNSAGFTDCSFPYRYSPVNAYPHVGFRLLKDL